MRRNFGAKPLLNPKPVLVVGTYNEDGTANAMVAAWGGVAGSDRVTVCISTRHKTAENLMRNGHFTLSVATADRVAQVDYLGLVSGHEAGGKLEQVGFHTTKSEFVDAPLIDELPFALECEMISWDHDSHLLLARVVNICAEERVLDEEGRVDMRKLNPIVYDSIKRDYFVLGDKVGDAYGEGNRLR